MWLFIHVWNTTSNTLTKAFNAKKTDREKKKQAEKSHK